MSQRNFSSQYLTAVSQRDSLLVPGITEDMYSRCKADAKRRFYKTDKILNASIPIYHHISSDGKSTWLIVSIPERGAEILFSRYVYRMPTGEFAGSGFSSYNDELFGWQHFAEKK